MEDFPVIVMFDVWSPPPPSDFRLIVTGSIPQLGNWFTEKPVSMAPHADGVWKLKIQAKSSDEFEYKYACYSNREGRCVGYEQGHNRRMVVAQKLEESDEVDPDTNMRIVSVRDVWSAVQPSQSARANGATSGQRAVVVPRTKGQAAPQAGGNQVVSHKPGAQSAAASVASLIQKQIMQDRQREGNAGSEETAKAVAELRKKLKESQSDQVAMLQRNKELGESHEKERKRLEEDNSRLQTKCEQLQAKIDQLLDQQAQQASAKDQKFAATIADLEKRQQELTRQLEGEREAAEAAREAWGKAEADLRAQADLAREEARSQHSELAMVGAVVGEFARGVKDEGVRERVMDEGMPPQERVGWLLQHYEERANSVKPEMFDDVLDMCQVLRDDLEATKRRVRDDIAHGIEKAVLGLEDDMAGFIRAQEKEKAVHAARYRKQYEERKRLANEVVDLKGKIRVFGRARPFNKRELDSGHSNVLAFPEQNRLLVGLGAENFLMLDDEVRRGDEVGMGENKIEEVKTYELDHIFPPETSQHEVFEEVRHLVASVLDGYNVTVLAYGQTGSGKTFTMDGTDENPGLIRRSLALYFHDGVEGGADHGRRVLRPIVNVSVSMLEIYNEEIRDLLSDKLPGKGVKYEIRQTPDGGTFVPNLTLMACTSLDHALQIMDMGRENRKTSETKMNQLSSRSHMVFTTYLEITHPVSKHRTTSKLHLVDLAGSERVSKSKASGEQLKEAMAINKSLSALGDVIAALTSAKASSAHVPYRNSKLTFLLQDSLCGNSRTAMFVNLSPSSDNFWETISTLNFGARAASVELGQAQRNFESGELSQLREQVKKLQAQLQQKGDDRAARQPQLLQQPMSPPDGGEKAEEKPKPGAGAKGGLGAKLAAGRSKLRAPSPSPNRPAS